MRPCIKISNQSEKITNPGIKNVMRFYRGKNMLCDLLYLEDKEEALKKTIAKKEPVRFNHPATDYAGFVLKSYDRAESLLAKVMENGGKRIEAPKSLSYIKEFKQNQPNIA